MNKFLYLKEQEIHTLDVSTFSLFVILI